MTSASTEQQFSDEKVPFSTATTLVTAVQQLASAQSVEQIAKVVRTAARQLVNSDGATFVLRTPTGECLYADEDAISPLWKGRSFPLNTCISGWAMLNKAQVVIEDIYQDDRIPKDAYKPTFVNSLVMTPVRTDDPIAAIGTYWAKNHRPDPFELRLLQSLADSTSVAFENVHVSELLKELLNNLEGRVAERTLELEQTTRELAQAKDAAVQASDYKSAFIANLSHELRTPLSGIVSTAELLAISSLDKPEERNLIDLLQTSASALLSILNDILDLAKIEAGRVTLERVPFNLVYVVQDAARAMSVSAAAKEVPLRCSVDYRLPELVVGDPVRLRQILFNLIGNAIKFTDQGEIKVSADLKETSANQMLVLFTVSDTGMGMSDDQLSKLFLPYVQADSQIAMAYGGTGLGLAISKQLVDLMQGQIHVNSAVGKGTTFSVTLPFDKAKTGTRQSLPAAVAKAPVSKEFCGLALIAEDNRVISELTLRQLASLGVQSQVVSDGQQAVAAMGEANFDLVLIDVHMPVLDGLDATRAIRKAEQSKNKHTPIIAMTASAMVSDQKKCLDAGMDDYISKPITLSHLREILLKWMPKERTLKI